MANNTNNLDPNRCASIIRGILGIKRRKQIELADKLGLNRVILNMYLNRKVNLLPEDIDRILTELGLDGNRILASISAEVVKE